MRCPLAFSSRTHSAPANSPLPDARPPLSQRTFSSPLLEARLEAAVGRIRDPDLAILLANCWPNTLDTTVFSHDPDPWNPSTWAITGDSQ